MCFKPSAMICAGAAAAAFVIASAPSAMAVPAGTLVESFSLGNHPDGAVNPPPYGLRLDGLFDGNAGTEVTFSFDPADDPAVDMQLQIYDDNGSLALFFTGTIFGGEDVGGAWSNPELFEVEMTYDNADPNTTVTLSSGFYQVTTTPNGTIPIGSIQAVDGTPGPIGLLGKADGSGLVFRTGTDIRNFAGISGEGWINHETGGLNNHLAASDWLFTATPAPEPATLAMLGTGLAGIGWAVRRRRQAA